MLYIKITDYKVPDEALFSFTLVGEVTVLTLVTSYNYEINV